MMDIYDFEQSVWEHIDSPVLHTNAFAETLTRFFKDYYYLLDERGVQFVGKRELTGPGGDWDIYTLSVKGIDSQEWRPLYSSMHDNIPDVYEMSRALAEFVASSQNGTIDNDNPNLVWF